MEYSYRLLINGTRGLYTSNARKLYFIDNRNETKLDIGIVKVSISKDFGNYTFIKGEMAENVGTLEDAVNANKVDLNNVTQLLNLNGYDWWIEAGVNDTNPTILAFINNEVVTINFMDESYRDEVKRGRFIREVISQSSKTINLHAFKMEHIDTIVSRLNGVDRQKLIEYIIRACTLSFPKSIKVYDNKVVVMSSNYSNQCYYCKEDSLVLSSVDIDISGMEEEDLTEEIKQIILDYGLVIRGKTSGVVSKRITCFNEFIDLSFLSTASFSFDDYDRFKPELQDSKKRLEEFKRRVGKLATRNTLDELQKLNVSKFQLGEEY